MFRVTICYRLCIVGHKLHRFVNLFHHCCEQQGKCSHIIWLVAIFLQFDWFRIFDAPTYILQDTLTLFHLQFYHVPTIIFNFEVTLFSFETTVIVNASIQVVMFIRIHFSNLYMVINTINSNTIGYYCYHHHYFIVCALQLINNTLVCRFLEGKFSQLHVNSTPQDFLDAGPVDLPYQ